MGFRRWGVRHARQPKVETSRSAFSHPRCVTALGMTLAGPKCNMLQTLRELRQQSPSAGVKKLLAQLKERDPDCTLGAKELRQMLRKFDDGSTAAAALDTTTSAEVPKQRIPKQRSGPACICWGCGGAAPAGVEFKSCGLCQERRLPPSYFCSAECLRKHWPRHNAWHKHQKQREKSRSDAGKQRDSESNQQQQQITKELLSSMSQMGMAEIAPQALKGEEWLAKGIQCMTMQDYRKAAAIFRKITALPPLATPDNPPSGGFVLLHTLIQAHANLGTALDRSDLPDQALLEYMKARELVDLHYQVSPITNTVDLNIWAGCTAHAFRIISNLRSQGREVHLPEWWNDNALKELSAQVMIRSSRLTESPLMMRGLVLYSWRYGEEWPFGERTLDELREATTVFQRLAGMCTAHEATYAQSAAELTCLVRLLTQTLQPDAPIPVSLLLQHQCFIWLWCATRSLPSGVHPSGPDP